MVDVGNFHIPLGPLMIVDGVFNMNVNQGLINHGLLFRGGILQWSQSDTGKWYLNPPIQQPFGVYSMGDLQDPKMEVR